MGLFAIATGIQIAYVVGLVVVLFLGPVTVAEMKGHTVLIAVGWFTLGIAWWIAAFRLALPDSWWARHFYGPRKLARAEARWGRRFGLTAACDGRLIDQLAIERKPLDAYYRSGLVDLGRG